MLISYALLKPTDKFSLCVHVYVCVSLCVFVLVCIYVCVEKKSVSNVCLYCSPPYIYFYF